MCGRLTFLRTLFTMLIVFTAATLSFFYKKLGFWPKPQTFLGRRSFEAHFFLKYFLILVAFEAQIS